MRILIIANKIPFPKKDGGAIATLSLAENMTKFCRKIDILAINTKKHYYNIKNIPKKITNKITFYDFFLNTNIKYSQIIKNLITSKIPYNAQRFISKKFEKKIVTLIKKNKYDIVQLEGLYLLPYIEAIKKNSNAKIAYRAHNIEHEIWERIKENTKNILKKLYINIIYKRLKIFELNLINKYDLIIPITNRDAKKFVKLGNKKPSMTIQTGINKNQYKKYNSTQNNQKIFFIGALDWIPNQEGIIWFINKCWTKIIKEKPQTTLHIAGRNAPKKIIKKLKAKNVKYYGEIENAHKFMENNGIMIVPLLAGGGMRIKIIEAMAIGVPIISTKIGAEGINAEKNNEIIIANKNTEIITETLKLINNNKLTKKIGENAKKFITENFDNAKIAKKLFQFYQKKLPANK